MPKRRKTPQERLAIAKEYRADPKATSSTLAAKYDVSAAAICRMVKEAGFELSKQGQGGVNHRFIVPEPLLKKAVAMLQKTMDVEAVIRKYKIPRAALARESAQTINCPVVYIGRAKKRHYDTTYRQAVLSRLGKKCKICDETIASKLKIDHCHRTGIVRGILCHQCNITVGYVESVMSRLESSSDKLVAYLKLIEKTSIGSGSVASPYASGVQTRSCAKPLATTSKNESLTARGWRAKMDRGR